MESGLGECNRELIQSQRQTDGAGAHFPHVGMAPLPQLSVQPSRTARLALSAWFTMPARLCQAGTFHPILQLEQLRLK